MLEVASLVTERLLATGTQDHSFLDAFLQGVDDLEDDKEESLVSMSIPTGGASLVEEGSRSWKKHRPAAGALARRGRGGESDDEYGDDSYEDEEYGDDDFDEFEEPTGGFSQDLSIEDYLRKVFASVDVNGDGEIGPRSGEGC